MEKEKILRQLYYSEDGLDSKAVTYKKAKTNTRCYAQVCK